MKRKMRDHSYICPLLSPAAEGSKDNEQVINKNKTA